MTTEQLLLCPCCKSEAKLYPAGMGDYIGCTKCGLKTSHFDYKEDAIKVWNTRPSISTINRDKQIIEAYNGFVRGIKNYRLYESHWEQFLESDAYKSIML